MKAVFAIICFLTLVSFSFATIIRYNVYWIGATSCDLDVQPDAVVYNTYESDDSYTCVTTCSDFTAGSTGGVSGKTTEVCKQVPAGTIYTTMTGGLPIAGQMVEVRSFSIPPSTCPTGDITDPSAAGSISGYYKPNTCTYIDRFGSSSYGNGVFGVTNGNTTIDYRHNCNRAAEGGCNAGCSVYASATIANNVACTTVGYISYRFRIITGMRNVSSTAAVYSLKYNSDTCSNNEDPVTITPVETNFIIKYSFNGNDTYVIDSCINGQRRAYVRVDNEDAPYQYGKFPFPFNSTYLEVRNAGLKLGCPVTVPFAHTIEKYVRADYCGKDVGVVSVNTQTGVAYGEQCSSLPGTCSNGCFYNYKAKYSADGYACSDDGYGNKKIFGMWRNRSKVEFMLPPFPSKIGVRSVTPGKSVTPGGGDISASSTIIISFISLIAAILFL